MENYTKETIKYYARYTWQYKYSFLGTIIAVILASIMSVIIPLYFKKFFDFSNPINFFVGFLELVSEFAKVMSFAFRLFGNIFAGEVLLTIIVFLVPYLIPLPFLLFEVFVGFMQAFVFSMLTMVFIAIHTSEEAH